jgi:hypothetical protein
MVEFTPIRPRAGGLTHAILLSNSHKTLCNRVASGWVISLDNLTCERCRELIQQPRSLK